MIRRVSLKTGEAVAFKVSFSFGKGTLIWKRTFFPECIKWGDEVVSECDFEIMEELKVCLMWRSDWEKFDAQLGCPGFSECGTHGNKQTPSTVVGEDHNISPPSWGLRIASEDSRVGAHYADSSDSQDSSALHCEETFPCPQFVSNVTCVPCLKEKDLWPLTGSAGEPKDVYSKASLPCSSRRWNAAASWPRLAHDSSGTGFCLGGGEKEERKKSKSKCEKRWRRTRENVWWWMEGKKEEIVLPVVGWFTVLRVIPWPSRRCQ